MKPFVRVLIATLSAFAIPLIASQEITGPTYGSSAYKTYAAYVATNGTTFLTLWTVDTNSGGQHIYGSLAAADGTLLTPQAFLVLADATVSGVYPYRGGYLAVVNDGGGLRPAILSADGKLVSLGGRIAIGGWERAFNGSEFGVIVYTDTLYPAQVTLQIASLDGTFARQTPPIGRAFVSGIGTDGQDFIVATAELNGVFVQRFHKDATQASANRFVQGSSADARYGVAVACSDAECGVTWWDASPPNSIHFAAITHDGALIGQSSFDTQRVGGLQLVWTGASYLVLTDASTFARFDRAGKLTDGPISVPVGRPGKARLAATPSLAYIAGGSSPSLDNSSVLASAVMLNDRLTVRSTTLLSTMLRRQVWPTLATNGIDFLALWSDEVAGTNALASMPLDHRGARLHDQQQDLGTVSPPPDTVSRLEPLVAPYSAAFGRDAYLVVWAQAAKLLGQRLTRSGDLLDSQPLVIRSRHYGNVSDRAAAWNGSFFLLAAPAPDGSDKTGVIVSESGAVVREVDLGPGSSQVYWDGKQFLVAAPRYVSCLVECTPTLNGVTLRRVASDGTLLDKDGATIDASSSMFRLATSGTDSVIAADTYGFVPYNYRIQLWRVRSDTSQIQISNPVTAFAWIQPTTSEIAWTGTEYRVVWQYGLERYQWIGSMRLTRDLIPIDRSYAPVTAEIYDRPAIAANALGETVVALSAISQRGSSARLRTFSDDDFIPAPAPPTPPVITSASVASDGSLTVTWSSAPAEISGFLIEQLTENGTLLTRALVAGTTRVATLAAYPRSAYVRIRAFNPGGIADPSTAFPLARVRVRSVRH